MPLPENLAKRLRLPSIAALMLRVSGRSWRSRPADGGISDGHALWAARVLGCDLAYMGAKFIATVETMADPGYKRMLVESTMDDVLLTRAFTGLDTNMLIPSVVAAGLDPRNPPERVSAEAANEIFGGGANGPRRWKDVWSAGHSVSGVNKVRPVAELIDLTAAEYADVRRRTLSETIA